MKIIDNAMSHDMASEIFNKDARVGVWFSHIVSKIKARKALREEIKQAKETLYGIGMFKNAIQDLEGRAEKKRSKVV